VVLLGGSRPPLDRPANVVATYGLTETGSGVVYDGMPLDGVEVHIAADGEILVRGPMLMRCYRDGSSTIDADGWLHTDDLGIMGPEGRLQVQGRRGDMIVTGGENVWPDAVERVIADLHDVAEVAVAGVPDPEWGQRVVAWVVPAGTATPSLADLRAAVGQRLAAFMAPKELHLVEALPRTAIGKVSRTALVRHHAASPTTTESGD
jgi:O-succinylbenzoic acid--CoA ligase